MKLQLHYVYSIFLVAFFNGIMNPHLSKNKTKKRKCFMSNMCFCIRSFGRSFFFFLLHSISTCFFFHFRTVCSIAEWLHTYMRALTPKNDKLFNAHWGAVFSGNKKKCVSTCSFSPLLLTKGKDRHVNESFFVLPSLKRIIYSMTSKTTKIIKKGKNVFCHAFCVRTKTIGISDSE